MTERAAPFYCPYCGEENLVPRAEPAGSWGCDDCRRVFSVTLSGLAVGGTDTEVSTRR